MKCKTTPSVTEYNVYPFPSYFSERLPERAARSPGGTGKGVNQLQHGDTKLLSWSRYFWQPGACCVIRIQSDFVVYKCLVLIGAYDCVSFFCQ